MKKALQISIPEPCHEDWAKMTPTQKGRHCASCEKEVTDYTQKTDEELVKLLSKNGTSCGRFKKSQINREVKLERKSTQSLAPYAASLLIPLSLMNSLNTEASSKKFETENTFKSIGVGRMSEGIKVRVTTTGSITDSHGNPLNNVRIYIKETGSATKTDPKGAFAISSKNAETIIVEKEGYFSSSYTTTTRSEKITIALQSEDLTESILVGEPAIIDDIPTQETAVKTQKLGEFLIKKDTASATVIQIKGTITDSSGLALPGVNIIIKGTTIGTQSDFDGLYSIKAEKGQTLVYSYVGFDTIEKNVTDNSEIINTILEEGAYLGEVVITGGYSISTPVSHDYYTEEKVAERKKRNQNTRDFMRIKAERKKIVKQEKRAERKAERQARKNK